MAEGSYDVEFVDGPFNGVRRMSLPAERMPQKMLMPVNAEHTPHLLSDEPWGHAIYERREQQGTLKYFFTGDLERPPDPQYVVELARPKRAPIDMQPDRSSEVCGKKWLRFEKLAEKIYAELQPTAVVKHDDRILGHDSTTKRQIDVSIRANVAGHDLLIIVDAKDHARPADITTVGSFSDLLRDVRASKGVMICNAGFTKGATNLAKSRGIDLCTAFDAESRDWGADLMIPVLMDNTGVTVQQTGLIELPQGLSVPDNPADWRFAVDSRPVEPMADFVCAWNNRKVARDVGGWHKFAFPTAGLHALATWERDGTITELWVPVHDYSLEYLVNRDWYFRFCEPDEYRGLKNLSSDKLEISALRVMVPKEIDLEEWEHVSDEQALHERAGDFVLSVQRLLTADSKDGKVSL